MMQPIFTLALGAAMILLGLTGILRRESGALSIAERDTVLGRAITLLLGFIWLITGIVFIVGSLSPDAQRDLLIGYAALYATAAFVIVLFASLLIAALLHYRERTHPAEPADRPSVVLPTPTRPRFRRMQFVMHPQYGRGMVLSSYKQNGAEFILVRFIDQVFSLPADSVDEYAADS
jgi:hypothetical protein